MGIRIARPWWLLGVPVGIAAGALLAIALRTSGDDALTLRRGQAVDVGFLARLDPPAAPAGPVLLLSFGYTSCPDVCPTTLLAVHRALLRLGDAAAQVQPVFVTVDPARDSAERLQQYVDSFDPRIRRISDPATAAAALAAFHARAVKRPLPTGGGYTVDHTAVLYVLDRGRRVAAALPEASAGLEDRIVAALSGLVGAAPAAAPAVVPAATPAATPAVTPAASDAAR